MQAFVRSIAIFPERKPNMLFTKVKQPKEKT